MESVEASGGGASADRCSERPYLSRAFSESFADIRRWVGDAAEGFFLSIYSNKEEKFRENRSGPFQTDASVYATPPTSGLRLTWMGHSSTLVEIDGMRVFCWTPVWDERASPLRWAGPKAVLRRPTETEADAAAGCDHRLA